MHVLKMCFKVTNCSIFGSLPLGTEQFGNNYVKHKIWLMKINKQNNFIISILPTYCKNKR